MASNCPLPLPTGPQPHRGAIVSVSNFNKNIFRSNNLQCYKLPTVDCLMFRRIIIQRKTSMASTCPLPLPTVSSILNYPITRTPPPTFLFHQNFFPHQILYIPQRGILRTFGNCCPFGRI